MTDDKHIGARVSKDVHAKLVVKAKEQDLTLSQILRRLVKVYIQDCEKATTSTREKNK